VAAIQELGGLAVAAHIDRQSFSVLSQLGFIPEDLVFDALEISRRMSLEEARAQFREYAGSPFITASDAHSLEEIGTSPTLLRVARPDLTELRLALTGQEGRMILGDVVPDNDGRPFTAHTGSC
jgi:PHP family Zn ribbon phosphoesterase